MDSGTGKLRHILRVVQIGSERLPPLQMVASGFLSVRSGSKDGQTMASPSQEVGPRNGQLQRGQLLDERQKRPKRRKRTVSVESGQESSAILFSTRFSQNILLESQSSPWHALYGNWTKYSENGISWSHLSSMCMDTSIMTNTIKLHPCR